MIADKGARFRKCDFQIHSPRDRNWEGPFDPIKERMKFAIELVAHCRRNGIDAIAITDHHDLCLWPVVSDAAKNERTPEGKEYPPEQRLVVFPGVELTLATPPCQALLLLDPDLTDETLSHIWGALGVAPSPVTEAKTTQTEPLGLDKSLGTIASVLGAIRTNPTETDPNKYQFLKGRFILLPNVKSNGHKTIMRHGNNTAYSEMPFVGGYIEGCEYDSLPQGDRNILEGQVLAWGKKSIGVFQTSDCRRVQILEADGNRICSFTNLGRWPTWVKWAKPSCEAIRQACLAKRSRISHHEPVYPLLQIVAVRISDSKFLGPIELGLNPQFNAFIGGRGTGKSSLLEYIRWALCDDPLPSEDSIELPNFQKRRKSLVDGTLKSANATVVVFYKRNEVIYRIERSITPKSDNITMVGPDGAPQVMTQEQVRREFPVVSYAQKQLSSVGTLPEEVNRLITDPVKELLATITDRISKEILPELRNQRMRQVRLFTLNAQLSEMGSTIRAKKEQAQALQTQLQALGPEQQKIVAEHDTLTQQDLWMTRILNHPKRLTEILSTAKKQATALGKVEPPAGLPQQELLVRLAESANAWLASAIRSLDHISNQTEPNSWVAEDDLRAVDELRQSYAVHKANYEKCVEDSAKNKTQLEELQSLNRQIEELESKHTAIDAERNMLEAVYSELGNKPWNDLLKTIDERNLLLRKQCETISGQAQYEFKAELSFCGDERPVRNAMASLIQGRNVKDGEEKAAKLASIVCGSAHPIHNWAEVMDELDVLCQSRGASAIPDTPTLRAAGFTDANLESFRNGVSTEVLEQIRYMNIGDQIRFYFRFGRKQDGSENYIPFDAASPGQQATCLLRTLLSQSGAPLLIDQPEEDLDNEQIHILSERISETKHNRQLLFVSHNANIVVNGDAELVACFGYRNAGDNTRGQISPVGSIDCEPVRKTITSIMEGGREAFELRMNKYGF